MRILVKDKALEDKILYKAYSTRDIGKSTFIKDNLPSECMVISRDKILLEVVKKYSKQDLKKQISTLENYDNHVAIDMMNLTVKSRKKFFNQV